MKTLKECPSIEEKINYVINTDPVELVGEIMGMETVIIQQQHRINTLEKRIDKMKTLKECPSIEDKIEYIKNTDPVELVGEIMGMEAVIIRQQHRINTLEKRIDKQ